MASTSITAIRSSSYENFTWPTIFLKHLLVDLISLSNTPPHQGAFFRLKYHSTLTLVKVSFYILVSYNGFSCLRCCLESLSIVRKKLVWKAPPRAESFQASNKCCCGHVWHNVKVHRMCDTTHVQANPDLFTLRHSECLDIQWSSKSTAVQENGGSSLTR